MDYYKQFILARVNNSLLLIKNVILVVRNKNRMRYFRGRVAVYGRVNEVNQ